MDEIISRTRISNVTLVAVATTEVEASVEALMHSMKHISFDKVLLISNYNPKPGISAYRYHKIEPFKNVGEWGKFIVFDLHKYIDTDYIILIHADGFIVNPDKWSEDFKQYDYIGAPWPLPKDSFSYRDNLGNIIRVGNSVSLRSLKLLQLPSSLDLDWESADHGFFHEDGFLCVQSRHILQAHGVKFAPLSVACRFSREATLTENRDIEPFAFHKWRGKNRKYPDFRKPLPIHKRLLRFVARLKQL
ncbi:DUF5672 family protein [Cyanobium sp. FACHB-13342]|uniref:DUF5672 family protein n=1 Tax=Cyanobium sp. FACHB-13342 TaxID=2692793 RepID=UPI00167FE916|nr:DUF5672 family protein [Cyanobium sp. FACHB-13342]MBD2423788.1 hypothetical protein [Cyanobium sp. FACHB-13342]